MIWTIIIGVIAFIIFKFLRDRKKMLQNELGSGGMKEKYSLLIQWLTNDPNAKIIKTTSDHIQISSQMPTTRTDFLLTQNFGKLEVDWQAQLGAMGNHNLHWEFSSEMNQDGINNATSKTLPSPDSSIGKFISKISAISPVFLSITTTLYFLSSCLWIES